MCPRKQMSVWRTLFSILGLYTRGGKRVNIESMISGWHISSKHYHITRGDLNIFWNKKVHKQNLARLWLILFLVNPGICKNTLDKIFRVNQVIMSLAPCSLSFENTYITKEIRFSAWVVLSAALYWELNFSTVSDHSLNWLLTSLITNFMKYWFAYDCITTRTNILCLIQKRLAFFIC